LVVGNEVNRQEQDYSTDEVMRAINYAKQQASSHPSLQTLDVTTCFSGTVLQPNTPGAAIWEPVVKACMQSVFLTIYPWYGNSPPGNIDGNMRWSYDNGMKQVEALNKHVIIGEIGWPSQGGRETSVANEELNYKVTDKWVRGGNFLNKNYFSFWFAMFDEPWKTQEGSYGPYWGLYGSGAAPKEKFKIPLRVAADV
jgi:exo-beta-1,3-glucanase (GH17 family)